MAAILTAEILLERAQRQNSGTAPLMQVRRDCVDCGKGFVSASDLSSKQLQDVVNITFGAPLFGDEAVRKFLAETQVDRKMFHLVAEEDPVPSLLSLAQVNSILLALHLPNDTFIIFRCLFIVRSV